MALACHANCDDLQEWEPWLLWHSWCGIYQIQCYLCAEHCQTAIRSLSQGLNPGIGTGNQCHGATYHLGAQCPPTWD